MKTATTNERIVGVFVVALALFATLWGRCVWLQVLGARGLTATANKQYTAWQTLIPQRGRIYDRNGRLLALSVLTPSVYANPRHVSNPAATAQRLAHLVERDVRTVRERLQRPKGFVWVARQVDPGVTPSLDPLRSEGIGIREEPKRFYPHGRLASHLLGFVNIDQNGLEGLELALNGMLRGQAGWRSTLRDARGHLLIGSWTQETEALDGADIVLTIDGVVQQVVEEALDWGMERFHAAGGSVVVMDPHTGAILALANRPTFDPNDPGQASADRRRNRAVTDLMEPGSVFKVVTAAAVLEEGVVSPEDMLDCEEGNWPTVGRHVLHDHHPLGLLSFRDVITYSSNIGTSKAAQRLSPDTLYRYVRAFGFGERSGIDIPGEVPGMVAPTATWSKLSRFIIPIGQEVAVTPIQLATMMAIIANGGQRVHPYVVERIQRPEGAIVRSDAPPEGPRVIRPEIAKQVQSLLVNVVESGTGRLAKVQGLTVAGKTGTAQKVEPNGRYSHSRFVASFAGFGPVPDSSFVIVVAMDEPRPAYYGGLVSAPMFQRIVEGLASYWTLPRREPAGTVGTT